MENYLETITKNTSTKGVSLRIANPYGIYQFLNNSSIGLIATILRSQLFDHELKIWGDGSTIRDYIHISDVSNAFLQAIESNQTRGVFNIGTGVGFRTNELIELISTYTKIKCKIKWLPNKDFNVNQVFLNSAKFESLTGWKAKIHLADGIRKLLENKSIAKILKQR